jgi:hypothetical protein
MNGIGIRERVMVSYVVSFLDILAGLGAAFLWRMPISLLLIILLLNISCALFLLRGIASYETDARQKRTTFLAKVLTAAVVASIISSMLLMVFAGNFDGVSAMLIFSGGLFLLVPLGVLHLSIENMVNDLQCSDSQSADQ